MSKKKSMSRDRRSKESAVPRGTLWQKVEALARDSATATGKANEFLLKRNWLFVGLMLIVSVLTMGLTEGARKIMPGQEKLAVLLCGGWVIVWLCLVFGIVRHGSILRRLAALIVVTAIAGYMSITGWVVYLNKDKFEKEELRRAQMAKTEMCDTLQTRAAHTAALAKARADEASRQMQAEIDGQGKTGKTGNGPEAKRLFDEKTRLASESQAAETDKKTIDDACAAAAGTKNSDPAAIYGAAHAVWTRLPERLRGGFAEPREEQFIDARLEHPFMLPYLLLKRGDPAAIGALAAYAAIDLLILLLGPLVIRRETEPLIPWLAKGYAALVVNHKNLLATMTATKAYEGRPSTSTFGQESLERVLRNTGRELVFYKAVYAAMSIGKCTFSERRYLDIFNRLAIESGSPAGIEEKESLLKDFITDLYEKGKVVCEGSALHESSSTSGQNSEAVDGQRVWRIDPMFYRKVLTPWVKDKRADAIADAREGGEGQRFMQKAARTALINLG